VYLMAQELGLYGKDLFLLDPTSQTSDARWDAQHHARKRHSYLWVFERVRAEAETVELPLPA
jgi:hypothetical protein